MMKRGFLQWNEREMSREDLAARKERVLERMREDGLDWLLVHGDISQCDNVHYLSHYNTYTRDCLLVLAAEGHMSLVSSLTLRDREWIADVTPVAAKDIFFGQGLLKTSEIVRNAGFSKGGIGLVGEYFPRVLLEHLKRELPEARLVDASDWYRAMRRVKDAAETRLVKRAGLLAVRGAGELQRPSVFGRRERVASAAAEWTIRSRGGEDYYFLCASRGRGYLDTAGDAKIEGRFVFSLLTQYMGCWAWLGRTSWANEASDRARAAYEEIAAKVASEAGIGDLDACIEAARAKGWKVEIKAPVGTDAESSLVPALDGLLREKGAIFTLRFSTQDGQGPILYGDTVRISEDGYEVVTC